MELDTLLQEEARAMGSVAAEAEGSSGGADGVAAPVTPL